MKKICKTLAAVLSAALLINSMFAVSTMKVYAEPAEENMTENEGTPEVPGTTDMEGDTLPDEDLLTDEEIAQLLAGDGAVSVFATRSANTLGKCIRRTFCQRRGQSPCFHSHSRYHLLRSRTAGLCTHAEDCPDP